MIERRELIAKAAAWMQARGWKETAARNGQRLFGHGLIGIGASVGRETNIAN